MAEIEVRRKQNGVMPWILGLLIMGAAIWGVMALFDDDDEPDFATTEVMEPVVPGATPEPMPETAAATDGILDNPARWVGQPFPGDQVMVAEVPTDRGFWIDYEGQRLFAILQDQPAEQPVDINPGQTISITEATLRDAGYLEQLGGAPLDEDTRRIAEQQPVFLVVDESNIRIQ